MFVKRPYTSVIERLRSAGLRPTHQRMALAKFLFEDGNRHVTAEQLHNEAMKARVRVSLATVYNTLHQFTAAGLLTEVVVDSSRSYFDTNTQNHYHFFNETSGELTDIPPHHLALPELPAPPRGETVERVDVIIRLV